ncbi:MAG: DUF1016 family protein [Bacilli bacterium]|nr:DUF1016 family protein [Bacilli bacterium]
MEPRDNPLIGIILSADKSDILFKYTLPIDNKQINASKYKKPQCGLLILFILLCRIDLDKNSIFRLSYILESYQV